MIDDEQMIAIHRNLCCCYSMYLLLVYDEMHWYFLKVYSGMRDDHCSHFDSVFQHFDFEMTDDYHL